jgi:hypothetical protein
MSTDEPETENLEGTRHWLETAAQATGSVGGALISLIMPGPEGQVIGAGMGSRIGSELEHAVQTIMAGRRRRASEALTVAFEHAAEDDVSAEQFLGRAIGDPLRLQLTAAALAAAAETALDAKVRVLGDRLASGVLAEDDAQVETEWFLIRTLAVLEAPHVRVLHQFTLSWRWSDGFLSGDRTGWSLQRLRFELPALRPILRPVLAVLASQALIDTSGPQGNWTLTGYGKQCLDLPIRRGSESS